MPGPWEKYQNTSEQGPWTKYAAAPAAASPVTRPAGLPPGVDLPALPAHPAVSMQSSAIGQVSPSLLAAGDVGKGLIKGALHTAATVGPYSLIGKTPSQARPTFQPMADASVAHNTAQKIGRGVEQVGEFFLPGFGEEAVGAKLSTLAAEHAPELVKAAPLAGRLATQTIGSGIINKAQGGSFGAGAAGGAIAGGIGEGLRALAPRIAESALNIRKLDRAYGRNPGRAILDETTGFSPGSVAESAQNRLNELNPMLNQAADNASIRSAPKVRGFLQSPAKEIPLGEPPSPPDMPGGLLDAQRFPAQNVGEARVIRNPQGQILPRAERLMEFPDETGKLPSARNYAGQFLTRQPTRQAWMTGATEAIPPTPEFSGPGVLLRREPVPDRLPIPPTVQPNRIASLGPARGVLSEAAGTATRQGERTTLGQLDPMSSHLTETIAGDAIPENITPRQLLDLKRGFGNEFIHRWNPETMEGVKGTAAKAYHQMGSEFNRIVPEGAELNGRISNLIPVAKRAESAELNAPTAQRIFHRVGAHTGALAGAVGGGYGGYREHGIPGAILGATLGVAAPEVIASPTGQMVLARGFNSGGAAVLPRIANAGILQLIRPDKKNK